MIFFCSLIGSFSIFSVSSLVTPVTECATTPEEVRREMQIAIDAGFDNPDPAVQEEWKKMTLKGDRPTPEEVINYAVKKLKGK